MRIGRKRGSYREGLAAPITVALVAWLVGMGCAGGSAQNVQQATGDRPLPRPPEVLVYDFSVDADDVVLDTFGPNFVSSGKSAAERGSTGRSVAELLAERLVLQLSGRGIRARRASAATSVPLNALAVKGQFVSIKEGDQMGRMVVGLGAGSEKLETRVQVYQMTPRGLRQISAGEGEAHGRKLPGVAGPAAVGAATGAAVGVVISSGMNIGSELSGGMKARVDDMAEEFSKRAVDFYKERGWYVESVK